MKKLMLLAACIAMLAGCTTAPQLTFQQQVSMTCGLAKGEIAILRSDGVFTGGAADTLANTVQPALDKVCAAGASVGSTDLQSIVNTALPALKTLVDGSSMADQAKNEAKAAIDTVILAANAALSMQAATVATAPVAASQ
ncbi:hypothetical protein PPMP20_04555 [Paraburkholderia phymatum]|uniref:Lipoprotein n=1 Tax=Paraburkholderia phymatum (strain DSM 17167 / CIP 108236 / LMG 21445 / STM815) TaxID=391038 RepID=B2JCY2_PARP8|nr:hypothetical protein [Paraburkholderia phymatum]ACC71038.1 conserved hypothetical protein [Paraburkholderia phymatum STM815]